MVSLKILGPKGHEEHEGLTPEQAQDLIRETEKVFGKRFFIVDAETQKLVREVEITEDQELVMIPKIAGG